MHHGLWWSCQAKVQLRWGMRQGTSRGPFLISETLTGRGGDRAHRGGGSMFHAELQIKKKCKEKKSLSETRLERNCTIFIVLMKGLAGVSPFFFLPHRLMPQLSVFVQWPFVNLVCLHTCLLTGFVIRKKPPAGLIPCLQCWHCLQQCQSVNDITCNNQPTNSQSHTSVWCCCSHQFRVGSFF